MTVEKAAAAMAEPIGFLGLVLVVGGVWDLWGRGWAMLISGGLLAGAYVWREARISRRRA